jgi:hypothetical protein
VVPEVGLKAEIYNNKNSSLLIGFFDTKQNTKVFQGPISAVYRKAEQAIAA